jgi:drug/metabolite transporter (DMT)-like permease
VSAPIARPRVASWLPGYLLLALIWGSSFLLIKISVAELHPVYLTLGRVLAGGLAVGAVLLFTRGRLPRGWRTWGHLLFVGTAGVAIPFTLFGYGEERISSVLAGIWNATTPLVALPIAALVFRTEQFSARKVAGMLLGFAGVLVVLGVWSGTGGSHFTGQLMCFAAAACYGVVIPYQRRYLSHLAGSGVAVPFGQLVCAGVVLAIAAPLVDGAPPAPGELSLIVIVSVIALGALGTGIAFIFHFRVIREAGATTAASVTYLIPLVATAIGILALGESLQWNQPAGAALVLSGVAISQGLLRWGGQKSAGANTPANTAPGPAIDPSAAALTPIDVQRCPDVG